MRQKDLTPGVRHTALAMAPGDALYGLVQDNASVGPGYPEPACRPGFGETTAANLLAAL